jgi:hypothetical protein
MGINAFTKQPKSLEVRSFLGRAIHKAGATPKYLICDKEIQFNCSGFKDWYCRKNIKPRFGAIGRHGGIAVSERFILTVKVLLACSLLVPFRREQFQTELFLIADLYNQYKPHTTLAGKTPDEMYIHCFPANHKPRLEPSVAWPRGSSCAAPRTLVKGQVGARIELQVAFHKGKKYLPIVQIRHVV